MKIFKKLLERLTPAKSAPAALPNKRAANLGVQFGKNGKVINTLNLNVDSLLAQKKAR